MTVSKPTDIPLYCTVFCCIYHAVRVGFYSDKNIFILLIGLKYFNHFNRIKIIIINIELIKDQYAKTKLTISKTWIRKQGFGVFNSE